MIEVEALSQQPPESSATRPEIKGQEKNRLIVHLARVFARRFDIQVIPSRQKGLWATSLDPKVNVELGKYLEGQRETLDDLPDESFTPRQILYDAESVEGMTMDEINTILHHEAGHAKYTDFRSMVEGQRRAKDEGYLPTSYWLTFEGIEDPRVNSLEGEESPAIDRQIRLNQGKDLQTRITEQPLPNRPYMLQFAYNSFHYWLHGEGIPELKDTDVGRLGELAKPLLEQYFQNTDVEQRKLLQKQIWDIAKGLEKKDIEDEKMRQMQEQQNQQKGQQEGQEGSPGQAQPGQGQLGQGEGQQSSGQSGGSGEGQAGTPNIPGGKGPREQTGSPQQGQSGQPNPSGQSSENQGQSSNQQKSIFERLRERLFGPKNQQSNTSQGQPTQGQESQEQEATGHDISPVKSQAKPKRERIDLSKLSDSELQQLKEAIDNLTPEQRAELEQKARETVDELQKEALEEDFNKSFKLEKNKQTGEYEVRPTLTDEKTQKQATDNYQQILKKVEAEEQAQWQRQERERQVQESMMKQLEQARREKLEMEKAGFNDSERDKFLLYQSLEDSMYSYVRIFKQAIEKVIPRRREPVYEGGYFSGPKFDKRDLVRKVPLGDQQFHMRQVERPTGEPRLFIGLLVDNSGSMGGKKMEQARKTMIFFAKVCKDMGIPFMGAAFGNDAEVIKSFRQDFDNPAEKIKPKIIDATNADGGGTNLHAGMEVTIEAMNEQRRRLRDSHGLIFVITDGEANAGLTGDALKNYVEENRGRLTFKGFGLSGSDHERASIQTYLNHYFGESNCAYPQGFDDLPDAAFRVLRINLMQFQRFLS